MPDTGNAKDCMPPLNFNIFTLKNVIWRTYLISFTVQCCFLFRFVCIELVSLIWFLQIWVAIHVYGTKINWFTLIKKLSNANVYRHSLWEYYKRFHCSFEWHLTPHMTLYIQTCIRRTPCIKRTLQHSPRVSAQVSLYNINTVMSGKKKGQHSLTDINIFIRTRKVPTCCLFKSF